MKKPGKRTTLKEDIGKLLLDIGKLVFGSIILGILLRSQLPQDILLIFGVTFVFVAFVLGISLALKTKDGDPSSPQDDGEHKQNRSNR